MLQDDDKTNSILPNNVLLLYNTIKINMQLWFPVKNILL